MEVLFIILGLLVVVFFVASTLRAEASSGTLGFNAGNAVKKQQRTQPAPRSPYRATSIVHGIAACNAVKAIGNKRFLDVDKATPRLPLPDCDASQCNCKYAHHDDRRKDQEDRRHPSALQSELYDKTGNTSRRKKKRGRRKTDWA